MVPAPSVFAYYSEVVLRDDDGASAIWRISNTEYVLTGLLLFLTAALDGAVRVACHDSQIGCNGQGVFIRLPSSVHDEV